MSLLSYTNMNCSFAEVFGHFVSVLFSFLASSELGPSSMSGIPLVHSDFLLVFVKLGGLTTQLIFYCSRLSSYRLPP